jgi:hypothetical protein
MGFHWLPFSNQTPPSTKDWETMLDCFPWQELWLQWPEDFPGVNEAPEQSYLVAPVDQPHLAQWVSWKDHEALREIVAWAKNKQIPVKCIDWPMGYRFSPNHSPKNPSESGFFSIPESVSPQRAAWMAQHLRQAQEKGHIGIVGEKEVLDWLACHWQDKSPLKKPKKVKVQWLLAPNIDLRITESLDDLTSFSSTLQFPGLQSFEQLSRWANLLREEGKVLSTTDVQDAWFLSEELAALRGKRQAEALDVHDALSAVRPFSTADGETKLPMGGGSHPCLLNPWEVRLWENLVHGWAQRLGIRNGLTLQVSAHLPHDASLRKWLYRGVLLGLIEPPESLSIHGLPSTVLTWTWRAFEPMLLTKAEETFAKTLLEQRLYECLGPDASFSLEVWLHADLPWRPWINENTCIRSFEEAMTWMWQVIWQAQTLPTRQLVQVLEAVENRLFTSPETAAANVDLFLGVWDRTQRSVGQVLVQNKLWAWSQNSRFSMEMRGSMLAKWLSIAPKKDWPTFSNLVRGLSQIEATAWIRGLLGNQPALSVSLALVHQAMAQADHDKFASSLPFWQTCFSHLHLTAGQEAQLWNALAALSSSEDGSKERWSLVLKKTTQGMERTYPVFMQPGETEQKDSLLPMEERNLFFPSEAMDEYSSKESGLEFASRQNKAFEDDYPAPNVETSFWEAWSKFIQSPDHEPLSRVVMDQIYPLVQRWQTSEKKAVSNLRSRKIDLHATVKHNLGQYDRSRGQLLPKVWKYRQKAPSPSKELWLCIDRSRSMQQTYPAVLGMAAMLCKSEAYRVKICLFDEDVIFLDGPLANHWPTLLEVAPEGNTNVGKALNACLSQIQNTQAQVWLWSDFRDAPHAVEAFSAISQLKKSGVWVGFAYPEVPGGAPVHRGHVEQLKAMQIPCFLGRMEGFTSFLAQLPT